MHVACSTHAEGRNAYSFFFKLMSYHQLNALYLKKKPILGFFKTFKTPTYVSAPREPSSGGVTQLHLLFKNHVHTFIP